MFDLPKEIIIFDTEFTAWKGSQARGWSRPDEYREIVQIGAVRTQTDTYRELDSFNIFVRPERNPLLSDYFIELTAITQKIIDTEGVSFEKAIGDFFLWCGSLNIYSWGNDGATLEENSTLLTTPFPFEKSIFFNIRNIFSVQGILADQYSSGTIVEAFGKEQSRRAHNALNDARTILDGLRELSKRASKN